MQALKLRLKSSQLEALQLGRPVSVTILPPRKLERKATIAVERRKATEHGARIGNFWPVVDAWNEADFIRDREPGEARNKPTKPGDVAEPDCTRELTLAVKEIGVKQLLEWLELYFAACKAKKHLWDGRNHGYSNAVGFCRSARRCHAAGTSPWYARQGKAIVPDKQPKLTQLIADAYAQAFLGRSVYGLRQGSRAYESFAVASKRVANLAGKTKLPATDLVEAAISAIRQRFGDQPKGVSPGNMASDLLWQDWVPQILRKQGSRL